MFKRVVWFGIGATSGAVGSMWARRRVVETVERFTPAEQRRQAAETARRAGTGLKAAGQSAGRTVRDLSRDARAAAADARSAMVDREAELRGVDARRAKPKVVDGVEVLAPDAAGRMPPRAANGHR